MTLSKQEIEALYEALDDEYRAWATYDQVIRDFGAQQPFVNIRDAEARHISALKALFDRYGLDPGGNPWVGKAPRFASTQEACEAGIKGEIANAAMYQRLTKSTKRADILAVFGHLKEASQDRHLPAFRRCASRHQPN